MHAGILAPLRLILFALLGSCLVQPASAATFLVNTNGSANASADALAGTPPYCDTNPAAGDQEACTLSAAIQIANLAGGRDRIEFDLPLITLTGSLPSIVHPLDIEGDLSGDDPATTIDGNGNSLFAFDNAASLNGGSSVVNLKLRGGSGTALRLNGTPYIVDNLWVGLNDAGTAADANNGNGIEVQNTVSKTTPVFNSIQDLLSALGLGDSFGELGDVIGVDPVAFVGVVVALLGQDNAIAITNSVISGNADAGVRIAGGQDTMGNPVLTAGVILAGNRIGTNATGTDTVPNGTGTGGDGSGVLLELNAALHFIIGNVIAANEGDGVRVSTGAVDLPNVIAGNFIGLPNPVDLPSPLALTAENWGNFEAGIHLGSFPSAGNATDISAVLAANFIGFNRCGTWVPPGNSDVDDGGIALTSGSDGAIVAGNLIGVAEFPVGGDIFDLGNLCDGINVSNGRHQIGGPNGADLNVIAANAEDGLLLRDSVTAGNLIQGNYIGRIPLAEIAMGNGGHGLHVFDSGGNTIGGPGNLDRNVIAHNGGHGVKVFNNGGSTDPDAWANLLQRNQIFDNALLGIDLDDPQNAANNDPGDPSRNTALDPTAAPGEAAHGYANWRQNAPVLCTGGGGFPCEDGGGNPIGMAPGYSGGTTTVMWSLATAPDADTSSAPEHRYRVEFFSDDGADGMTFLEEREVTVGADGRPTGCTNGVCTATMMPTTQGGDPINTAGTRIVATATLITDALDRPGGIGAGPANNTSEFSAPAQVPDQIVFSQANYTVAENEPAGEVEITLSRIGSGAASITLSLADITTQPADYGALSATTLSWAIDEAPDKTITLAIIDDAIDEPNQSLGLSFVIDTSDNAIIGDPGTAQVTITDNESPPLLTIVGAGATEGADLVYTVTRNGASEFTSSVGYAATPDPGAEAADIDASADALSGTVSILPNAGSAEIRIRAFDDAIDEAPETIRVELSNPVQASLNPVGGNFALAAIADNDAAPVFNIDSPNATETDANAALVFTVTKVGLTEFDTSVAYATSDGSATTPEDYIAGVDPLAGTLDFGPADAMRTISLVVVGDDVFEPAPAQTFSVQLSAPVQATLGTATGTATITDDDTAVTGEVRFTAASFGVNETNATVDAVVTVERINGSDGPASVDCVPAAGTATAGADFTAAAVSVSWLAGESGTRQCLVPIVGDSLSEEAETIALSLSNANGASVGTPATATLTITDDDPLPVVSISAPMATAEGDAPDQTAFVFNVQLSAISGRSVTVQAMTQDGTATLADADYVAVNQMVTFAPGVTMQTVTVNVVGDPDVETSETFTVELSAPDGATLENTPELAEATILDDDAPPPAAGQVRFTASAYGVGESAGPAVVSVERVNGNAGAVSVDCVAAIGTASAADFTPATQTLDWAAGEDGIRTCSVAITPDMLDEDDETVMLALGNAQNGVAIDSPSAATLTITDDDALPQVSIADLSLPEGDGPGATPFNFVVTLSVPSGRAVSVTASTSDGSASAPGDYATLGAAVNFPAGSTSQVFSVAVVGDATDETIDETFEVTLSAPVNATLAADPSATGTIQNDDAAAPPAGTLQFSAPTYTIGEAGVQATITVTRSGGSAGAVTVGYATSNGSATAGSDYTAAAGTLTWGDGVVTDQSFVVPVTNDASDEADETVNLTLSAPTNGAALGAPNTAVLTITDDDPAAAAGTLQFGAPTYSIGEAGVQAMITVTRTGGSAGAVTVAYASSNGSATAGSDYTAVAGMLSWGDGVVTDQTFMVPISNDATDETDETVNLSLSAPTNGAALGANSNAVLTITDDDPPPPAGTLQFSAPTYSIGEAGVQATITVTRSGGSVGSVAVSYASSNGSATAGGDYTAVAGTLTWPDGVVTDQSFAVPITNDATDESDETVNLALSAPTNGAALGIANAVLTITDDDGVPGNKSFSGPTPTGSGTQTVVFTGGGDPCGFAAGTGLVATPQPLPAGNYVFPHGVFASTIDNCTTGAVLSFTVTYPQALPAGSVFWKYGRTLSDPTPHWYIYPATLSGATATFTLTDGGAGDDDLVANGTIVDPSGPAFVQLGGDPASSPRAIPTLGEVSRWLLIGLFALVALWQMRGGTLRMATRRE